MRTLDGKRYWLVGASEGLGRALAMQMSDAGASLVLSARNGDRLDALARTLSGPTDVVPLDVTDTEACQRAADDVGAVDGIVYLAAVYWPMSATALDTARAVQMCDVNLTGAMRVVLPVVDQMVQRDTGHVVLVGSLSGYRGLPGAVGYGASKAGLMSLAETLHADLRKTGVAIQWASPGFIRTRLTDQNDFSMPFLMEPDAAAGRIVAHMRSGSASCSFPRPFSWVFRLSQFLPDCVYYRLFAP